MFYSDSFKKLKTANGCKCTRRRQKKIDNKTIENLEVTDRETIKEIESIYRCAIRYEEELKKLNIEIIFELLKTEFMIEKCYYQELDEKGRLTEEGKKKKKAETLKQFIRDIEI
ncbi:MAG: hypothetical protein HFJ59_03110 [Clostridia bacterium]|nr:hypothetical protein [Clostridia bacterium]